MKKKVIATLLGTTIIIGITFGATQLKIYAENNITPSQQSFIEGKNLQNVVGQNTIHFNQQLTLTKSSEDIWTYQETSDLVPQKQNKSISQKIIIYEDQKKNQYHFSQESGFLRYFSYEKAHNLPVDSSSITSPYSMLHPEDVTLSKIKSLLEETIPLSVLIPDFEQYEIKNIDSTYGLYVILEKAVSTDLQDKIFLDFDLKGNLEYIGTYRTNLTQVTDAQKATLEKKFQAYLKKFPSNYDRYSIEGITYQKIGDQLVANYSVLFYTTTDAEDMKLGDLVTFLTDA